MRAALAVHLSVAAKVNFAGEQRLALVGFRAALATASAAFASGQAALLVVHYISTRPA